MPEKSKEDRFQSATEVLEALTAVERGLPVTGQVTTRAKPLTAREITVKFSLKKILVPALVVAALVIVGIVSLINRGGKEPPAGGAPAAESPGGAARPRRAPRHGDRPARA